MSNEIWVSLSGQVLVFSGLVFTILKFSKEKKREFQKRFFEEQLKAYYEVVNCAAIISQYDKDGKEYLDAVKDFKRLFWGRMAMFENTEVETKMSKFKDTLDEYYLENDVNHVKMLKVSLEQAGLALAHTCRNSIIHTWEIDHQLQGFNDYSSVKQDLVKEN